MKDLIAAVLFIAVGRYIPKGTGTFHLWGDRRGHLNGGASGAALLGPSIQGLVPAVDGARSGIRSPHPEQMDVIVGLRVG